VLMVSACGSVRLISSLLSMRVAASDVFVVPESWPGVFDEGTTDDTTWRSTSTMRSCSFLTSRLPDPHSVQSQQRAYQDSNTCPTCGSSASSTIVPALPEATPASGERALIRCRPATGPAPRIPADGSAHRTATTCRDVWPGRACARYARR